MKQLLVILIVLATGSLASTAQKNLSPRDILDQTSEHLAKSGGISAKFTSTAFKGTSPQDSLSGTIDILGDKYVMKTNAMCTWFNGQHQWNLMAGNEEVTLVSPTPEELQATSPLAFMSIYKSGFNLSSKKTELRGKKIWDVTLKPKKKGQHPEIITISIDQQTFDPLCIRIRNQGNWMRISIKDFKTNLGFSSTHFSFPTSEFPKHQVIDMR